MGMIAQCYERGIGVAADPVRAREWYDRIATKSILKRSTS